MADLLNSLVKAGTSAVEVYRTARYGDDVPWEDMRKSLEDQGMADDREMTGEPASGGLASGLADPTDEHPRALFHDPYSVMDWGGWRERPTSLTYETLRQMAVKNTVVAAIINLRVNQVSQFAMPQQTRYEKGYRVQLRDRRDMNRTMTNTEAKQATEIERMLETTGLLQPNERPADRDSFKMFIKKGVRDILIYDQWCFEKIRDRKGRISKFIALPAETIRPAVSDWEHMNPAEMRERVSHVQVYEDTVIAEFAPDDIAWCVMNPRSDLRVNSFGFSPLEQCVNLVTAWLFGFEYNQRFFTQGSAIKGVINIKGAIPDRQLRAFRRLWYSMVSGVNNAWRTPILNSEDIQWVSMHANNREMEYSAWQDWLTKLLAAVYGVDPIEINFQFGNTGQKSSMNEGNQESKIIESKDKGLRPLMEYIADELNRHIIWEINPDFELAFTGLDAQAEEHERAGLIEEVQNYRTVNEVRAQLDQDPLPEGGDIILNTVFQQALAATQGAEQEEDQGDESGGPMDIFSDGDEDEEGENDGEDKQAFDIPGSQEDQNDLANETRSGKPGSIDQANKSALATTQGVYEELRKARVSTKIVGGMMNITIDVPEEQP